MRPVLEFLTPARGAAAPAALSPFDPATSAAGATFEVRDGWRVPTGFGDPRGEAQAVEATVGWTDASQLGKLEIQVAADAADELAGLAGGLELGRAVADREAWWCLLTPARALVLGEPSAIARLQPELAARSSLHVLDVTTQYAALRIGGPLARETFARFCALDLRDSRVPVRGCLPGSVARTPGLVVREAADQFLLLTGAALAVYLWEVVTDAGKRLGGRPVGVDVLPAPTALEEVSTGA
jgi:heterotetrameric sarcosine oxidase gamma subunit